jgi:ribosomal protein L37AE/L43A
MRHHGVQEENQISSDNVPMCSECDSTDKPMSNANGRTWICDDCRLPSIEDYKFDSVDIKSHLEKRR